MILLTTIVSKLGKGGQSQPHPTGLFISSDTMALTWLDYLLKSVKTIFYAALVVTVFYQGFFLLQDFLNTSNDPKNPVIHFLRILVGSFFYGLSIVLSVSLLLGELAEEKETDIRNTSRYAVHERKLASGFLKDRGMQTKSNIIITELEESTKIFESEKDPSSIILQHSHLHSQMRKPHESEIRRSVSLQCFKFPTSVTSFCQPAHRTTDKFLANPEFKRITFKEIEGLDKLKNILHHCVILPLVSPSAETVDVPRAVMFIGIESTDKPSIADGLVGQLSLEMVGKVKFYKLECSNCFGPFIGCGTKLQDIFQAALENNDYFSVILFGNVNCLYDESLNTFLSNLASVPRGRMLILATCKCREQLDHRLLDSGKESKFDYIFDIGLPDFWERVVVLKILFAKTNCPIEEQSILELSEITNGLNIGELERLVEAVKWKAIQKYNSFNNNSIGSWSDSSESSNTHRDRDHEQTFQSCNNNNTFPAYREVLLDAYFNSNSSTNKCDQKQ